MYKKLTDYSNPNSLGSKLRKKRSKLLVNLLDSIYEENGSVSILDAGGRNTYWDILEDGYLEKIKAKITILNIPSEKAGTNTKSITHFKGDACNMPQFTDNQFDLIHSNSVIEHVGPWKKICEFAHESQRVSKHHFIQTPNFWFPIEPHYMSLFHHWLPRPLRIWSHRHLTMGYSKPTKDINTAIQRTENEPYLLNKDAMAFLYPNCNICHERFFLFSKSLIAIK